MIICAPLGFRRGHLHAIEGGSTIALLRLIPFDNWRQIFQYRTNHLVSARLYSIPISCASDIGCERNLVRIIYTGEALQFTQSRSFVQPFRITFLTNMQGCINVNFKEATNLVANLFAGCAIGRNSGHKSDDSIAGQQLRHKPDPSDILVPVHFAETEIGPELFPNNVRIENFHSMTANQQFRMD